jgi:hypothetical protein
MALNFPEVQPAYQGKSFQITTAADVSQWEGKLVKP